MIRGVEITAKTASNTADQWAAHRCGSRGYDMLCPYGRKCEGAARYGLLFGRAGFTFRALDLETCTKPGFAPRGFVTLRA